jgi:hypothetical protein
VFDLVGRASGGDDDAALGIYTRGHKGHLRPAIPMPNGNTCPMIFLQEFLRISNPCCPPILNSLAVTVRAPEPAIDPQLGQLHGIGVRLAPGVKSGSPPAEDGNLLIGFTVLDNNRRTGDPFSGVRFF